MAAEAVRVFEAEPELLGDLPRRSADEIRRNAVARVIALKRGEWQPPVVTLRSGDLGLLILDGLVLRQVEVVGRSAVELVGSGDIVRPWSAETEATSVPATLTVKVCEPTRVAVLDRHFAATVAGYPEVLARVIDRLAARSTALAFQLAIAQLPQLEARLLCLLWHLADRWGHVRTDGIQVRLNLSQQTLADLASARRPSVSAALGRLQRREAIARERRGTYLLLGSPPQELQELRTVALA